MYVRMMREEDVDKSEDHLFFQEIMIPFRGLGIGLSFRYLVMITWKSISNEQIKVEESRVRDLVNLTSLRAMISPKIILRYEKRFKVEFSICSDIKYP